MNRKLDDLSSEFKPRAMELLARLVENNIQVMIICTSRTLEEQKEALKNGFSSTLNGKHLTGNAIDICPYEIFQLHGPDKLQWDSEDVIWLKIGHIGESLGLRWGGRWKKPHDPGHFELVK
jgi:hypothetical protein